MSQGPFSAHPHMLVSSPPPVRYQCLVWLKCITKAISFLPASPFATRFPVNSVSWTVGHFSLSHKFVSSVHPFLQEEDFSPVTQCQAFATRLWESWFSLRLQSHQHLPLHSLYITVPWPYWTKDVKVCSIAATTLHAQCLWFQGQLDRYFILAQPSRALVLPSLRRMWNRKYSKPAVRLFVFFQESL